MGDQENTAEQSGARSFEERVMARFDAMDERFSSLEQEVASLKDTVERRLYDTRPIWEEVQKDLRQIKLKLDQIAVDLLETRANQLDLTKRVGELETTR